VKHSEDFERPLVRAVNDEVRIYRPEENIFASRQIAALVTGMWMLSQPAASVADLATNPGRRLDTVAGNVRPNLFGYPGELPGRGGKVSSLLAMQLPLFPLQSGEELFTVDTLATL
jgi:hypothetical protein